MKARKVKGLDPDAPLADMAERIVSVRLEELTSFAPKALDPANAQALHDMRIAAKRLRYLLEVTAPCFGPYVATAAKLARQLQDTIGEIHDCDVMLPLVEARLAQLRADDSAELLRLACGNEDLSAELAAAAPNRAAYRGLEVMCAHLQARRSLLFERFLERWSNLEGERFAQRLRAALAERPADRDAQVPTVVAG